jgi:FKBP-type peptidyl-prolyl cis-trans isomerase SlyD
VEAYGERRENRIQRIPSKHFRNAGKLRPGQWVSIQTRSGAVQAAVVKVGRFNVDVDTNHPLAGQSLTFDVEVMSVRDATPEEISHGHVHGPGGAHD